MREKIRDANFADESMEMRIERRERQWGKQVQEHSEKMEIVRLGQEKTIEERDKVARELNRKKANHQQTKEAWERELQIVMREQAVSVMIQESYMKEISRVKHQIIAANEAEEEQKAGEDGHSMMGNSFHLPPNTASSNHRFNGSKKGGAPGKKSSHAVRRFEASFMSNHEFSKPAKSVRPTLRGQQPL